MILVYLAASPSAALQSKDTLQSFLICSLLLTRSSCLCLSLKWAKFEMDPSHSHESCHVTIPPGQCREKFVLIMISHEKFMSMLNSFPTFLQTSDSTRSFIYKIATMKTYLFSLAKTLNFKMLFCFTSICLYISTKTGQSF